MAVYLVDFENVRSEGLRGVEKLSNKDKVIIFYSKNADAITFDVHMLLSKSNAEIETYRILRGGHNSLDFQLSTYLGYLVMENCYKRIVIVSKDKGFLFVTSFWEENSEKCNAKIMLCKSIEAAELDDELDIDIDDGMSGKFLEKFEGKSGLFGLNEKRTEEESRDNHEQNDGDFNKNVGTQEGEADNGVMAYDNAVRPQDNAGDSHDLELQEYEGESAEQSQNEKKTGYYDRKKILNNRNYGRYSGRNDSNMYSRTQSYYRKNNEYTRNGANFNSEKDVHTPPYKKFKNKDIIADRNRRSKWVKKENDEGRKLNNSVNQIVPDTEDRINDSNGNNGRENYDVNLESNPQNPNLQNPTSKNKIFVAEIKFNIEDDVRELVKDKYDEDCVKMLVESIGLSTGKQHFYRMLVDKVGHERGLDLYRRIKGKYANLKRK